MGNGKQGLEHKASESLVPSDINFALTCIETLLPSSSVKLCFTMMVYGPITYIHLLPHQQLGKYCLSFELNNHLVSHSQQQNQVSANVCTCLDMSQPHKHLAQFGQLAEQQTAPCHIHHRAAYNGSLAHQCCMQWIYLHMIATYTDQLLNRSAWQYKCSLLHQSGTQACTHARHQMRFRCSSPRPFWQFIQDAVDCMLHNIPQGIVATIDVLDICSSVSCSFGTLNAMFKPCTSLQWMQFGIWLMT